MFLKKLMLSFLTFALLSTKLPLHAGCCIYEPAPPGSGYCNSRNCCLINTSIAIGIIVFGAMYIILVSDGKGSHSH